MKEEVTKLQAYRREIKTESESRISTCQICGKEITFGRIFCEEHDIPINKQIYEFFSEFPKNKDGLLIRPRGEKLYQVIKYYLAARLGLTKEKRIIMKSCTGAGKSVMLDMLAFIEMTHFPSSLTIIGSISEAVSKMHIERLREWIGGSVFNRYMVGTQEATASKTEIKLAKLNSKVMAMPQSPKSRTGWHASLLLVDEVGRMDPQSYYACYDNETDILTENGWLSLKEIVDKRLKIKVATLNPKENLVEYHYPSEYFKKYYNGELLHHESKQIDIRVTPNHRMWIKFQKKDKWHFKKAYELNSVTTYRRDFPWEGNYKKYIEIDEYKFETEKWFDFFGLYLAEGWVDKRENRNTVYISATYYLDSVRKILDGINVKYTYSEKRKRFRFIDKSIKKFLVKFGNSHTKYIPQEYLKYSKKQLERLFRSMYLGDGTKKLRKGYYRYTTVSEKLSDNVLELILKMGLTGYAKRRSDKSAYDIIGIDNKDTVTANRKNLNITEYSNYVYCLEVPNHLMYVRRNGKPCWSGNSFSQMAAQGGIEVLASTPYLDSITMQNIWNSNDIIKIALEPEECFWIPKEIFRKKEEEYRIGGYSALYEQLYGAQFRSLTNRVIPDDLLLQSMAKGEHYPTSKNLIMGIDFGKSIDFTAIVVIDIETGDVKFVDTFQDDWPIQFAKIRKYAKEWNPIKIVADSSHIGDVILSDLRELNIEGVSMHNDILKKSVIDRLIMAFFNNKLNIVSEEFPKLVSEISSYVYYDSDHKKMGPSGRGHDDCVVAISLALRGLDVTSVRDTHLPDNLWSFTRVGGKSSNPWAISNV